MKVLLVGIALSFCCVAASAATSEKCDECRVAAERKAQACESAARVEMQRQKCRADFRNAMGRCYDGACKNIEPAANECESCRVDAQRKAQACESKARTEMERQMCRTGLREAMKRCDSDGCRQSAPVVDECAQCRKEVQLKAQACQSGARDKAQREACVAEMNEGNASCAKSSCQKG